MNVEEVPRGLRVLTVFKGSPAAKGGLKPGDEIVARQRPLAARRVLRAGHDAHQGPRRHRR